MKEIKKWEERSAAETAKTRNEERTEIKRWTKQDGIKMGKRNTRKEEWIKVNEY